LLETSFRALWRTEMLQTAEATSEASHWIFKTVPKATINIILSNF
jgi:hypothetical protein